MIPAEFAHKWTHLHLTEKAGAHSWFIDLCAMLDVPIPSQQGMDYVFEQSAAKLTGGTGWADVWYRGHFAWEFKGRGENLDKAYQQLKNYAEALENPPLLVVSDFERIVVHTNFTNAPHRVTTIGLAEIEREEQLKTLRAMWENPDGLKPGYTPEEVTAAAANQLGALALVLRDRGVEPHRAAHFTVELLFCFFAEDIGLLPKGLFTQLLDFGSKAEVPFNQELEKLLLTMRDGGFYNFHTIPRFNGGLFDEVVVEPLTVGDIRELRTIAGLDWGRVEPAIFGTLFERSLDPARRSQLGAHYTGVHDIERVVEPVVMTPLRRRWEAVREEAEPIAAAWKGALGSGSTAQVNRQRDAFRRVIDGFLAELRAVTVLDPACGSGNFLYVALRKLMDLEKEVIAYAAGKGLPHMFPRVEPDQVLGLEINEYAVEITRTVVWIGFLQWRIQNGFGYGDPVLKPLDTIRLQDALLDLSDPEHPKEAEWPAAEYIVGNPPFLGGSRIRSELGSSYLDSLWKVYGKQLIGNPDLVCYFFEKARSQISSSLARRAGLLSTNSIRAKANNQVLARIKDSGDIFLAWSDEAWVLDGAQVRISIVGFDDGRELDRRLDGQSVSSISSELRNDATSGDVLALAENMALSFAGNQPTGPFEIEDDLAIAWLSLPTNPNGHHNSDVLRPYKNAIDLVGRRRDRWIIDFGSTRTLNEAAMYEAPFEHVKRNVLPIRESNPRINYRRDWWLHGEHRPALRLAITNLNRFVATPRVSKHRIFVWLPATTLVSNKVIVIAREDDYIFGVLQSAAHEIWSIRRGSSHGAGNDLVYTPTTCFETFPFPWPPGEEPSGDARVEAIAAAAKELDEKRRAWLDPPGAEEAVLKKRTLTNLYNERPTWLQHCHAALDRAVWDAYGWPGDEAPGEVGEEVVLGRLLALNRERTKD